MGEKFLDFEKHERTVKKLIRAGVAAGIVLYGSMALPRRAEAQQPAGRPVPEKQITEAEAAEGLLTDKTEKNLVRTNADKPGYYREVSSLGQTGGYIKDEDIDRIIGENPGVKEIELAHPHQLSSYKFLLDQANMEKIRNRQQEAVPMAPSASDYIMLAHFQRRYQDKGITVRGKVIALHGQFTYTVDPKNRFFAAYDNFIGELKKRYDNSLTEKDKALMKELVDNGTDLRFVIDELGKAQPDDPKQKEKLALAQKLEGLNEGLVEKYSKNLEPADEIELLNARIVQTDPQDKAEVRRLVAELKELCAKHGIKLEFKEM